MFHEEINKRFISYSSGLAISFNVLKISVARVLKGYLHYKTITSQNASSEAQIKNFFIS